LREKPPIAGMDVQLRKLHPVLVVARRDAAALAAAMAEKKLRQHVATQTARIPPPAISRFVSADVLKKILVSIPSEKLNFF